MTDLTPIWLSLQLAFVTTLLLFVVAMPIAYQLAYKKFWLKPVVETLVSMPLVLPPTVLGFYLLLAFSPEAGIGRFLLDTLGLRLVFSFEGLVFASIIYSLPFMVHPLQNGFQAIPHNQIEAAGILGKNKWQTLWYVQLPQMKASLLTGMILSFAHTIGEFGVVLMIGGNIPGVTKVASIAIYDAVESMRYASANLYSLILLGFTFAILLLVYVVNGGYMKKFWK